MAVRKRKSAWMVDFRYIDPESLEQIRFRRSTGPGLTRKEAEKQERRWRHELENPPERSAEQRKEDTRKRAAFSGFAKHWLELRQADWKPSYTRTTEQIVRVHLAPFFGHADLRDIGVEKVEQYKGVALSKVAAKTVNNHLGVLGSLFSAATRWGYCEVNPVRIVSRVRTPPNEFRFWEKDDSEAFLAVVLEQEPQWHPLFFCALHTGLRAGELFALTWADVDFRTNRLHVRRSWTHGHLGTPKSGRQRSIPLSDDLREVLLALKGCKGKGKRLVFEAPRGGYLNRDMVKHVLWRGIERAEVERVTFHELRHSFASQLVIGGAPIKVVQELLGHADIKMTMRYAHLGPDTSAEYVQILNRTA